MWVKICANTNLADAQLAAELGADAVGFVFAPSKRQVTPEQVAAITPGLPDSVERIGVFLPSEGEAISAAVRGSGLTGVQLHGGLDRGLIRRLTHEFEGRLKLTQLVAFETALPLEDAVVKFEGALDEALAEPELWGVLLDAAKSGNSGGLGVAFDWEHAAAAVERARARCGAEARILLAGGLNAGNVAAAVGTLTPFGVDVASGVEAQPGRKDPERLREFLQAARGAALFGATENPS